MDNDELLAWLVSETNIGAYTFAREALRLDHDAAEYGLTRLSDNDIPGEYIYVLWNDCCERDTKFAIEVMKTYSMDKILEALDNLSSNRYKFKNLKKEARNKEKEERKFRMKKGLNKLSLVFSCLGIITAVINVFIQSTTLLHINWVFIALAIFLCCLQMLIHFTSYRKMIKEGEELVKQIDKLQEEIEKLLAEKTIDDK